MSDNNQTVYHEFMWHNVTSGQTIVYNLGDVSWVLSSTALVWLMIPGIGFFYSGLLRRKNALKMIYFSMTTLAVVSFQWFFWGYSLAYSDGANLFIGDLKYFALRGVLDKPSMGSRRIPALVHCLYQLMFAAFTPMLALGGFAERCRLGPVALFVFVWSTVVYDPIACWTWNDGGWSSRKALDYAGGTPVHISSGTAALAISIYLGKRFGYGTDILRYKPHNTTYVVLGTVFLWFGWFGFNGGSALSASLRAAQACIVSNLAASVGGLTWMFWDFYLNKKWSVVGFCSGAISGLVAITPGAGYVGAPAAIVFGVAAGTVCNFATQLKFLLRYDECLDVFACHGFGGLVGNILTALFAQASIAALDGPPGIIGGWPDHHYIQLAYQLAESAAGFAYSFVMTTLILWIFHFVPFLRLRTNKDAEIRGIDDNDLGEYAYDYINLDIERGFTSERIASSPMRSVSNHLLVEGVAENEVPRNRPAAELGA